MQVLEHNGHIVTPPAAIRNAIVGLASETQITQQSQTPIIIHNGNTIRAPDKAGNSSSWLPAIKHVRQEISSVQKFKHASDAAAFEMKVAKTWLEAAKEAGNAKAIKEAEKEIENKQKKAAEAKAQHVEAVEEAEAIKASQKFGRRPSDLEVGNHLHRVHTLKTHCVLLVEHTTSLSNWLCVTPLACSSIHQHQKLYSWIQKVNFNGFSCCLFSSTHCMKYQYVLVPLA